MIKQEMNDIVQSAKQKLYEYVDSLVMNDYKRQELLLNLGMNLICQLIVEAAVPNHGSIKNGFDEVMVDMTIWRDNYLSSHPDKNGIELIKEIAGQFKPKKESIN